MKKETISQILRELRKTKQKAFSIKQVAIILEKFEEKKVTYVSDLRNVRDKNTIPTVQSLMDR